MDLFSYFFTFVPTPFAPDGFAMLLQFPLTFLSFLRMHIKRQTVIFKHVFLIYLREAVHIFNFPLIERHLIGCFCLFQFQLNHIKEIKRLMEMRLCAPLLRAE